MANQIKGKYIKNDAVSGSKILMLNDEPLRALKADGSQESLFKLNGSDQLVLLKMPRVSADASDASELVRKSQVDSLISSAESGLQSQINTEKNRIDAILSAADADKDSFAEIVALINSVDATNDSAFAGYVLSNDAALANEISARQSADDALDARLDTIEGDDTVEGSVAKALKDAKDYTDAEASTRQSADDALDARLDVIEGIGEGSVAKAEQDAKDYADSLMASEVTARESADSSLQSQINTEKGRVDAILSAADADKDSFAEIVALINSVDATNDSAFAGYVLSNDARVGALESFAIAQVMHVSKNGNDTTGTGGQHKPFLTIAKALSMITDASPTKRYAVRVAAGSYTETSVALPSNVFVIGEQKENVRITGAVSMGAWTQNNSGSDDRSGFSMVTLLSAADFNWNTAKSRAGKLYMNEVVFGSTVNMYGYDNAIAQAQFDSCVIFGAVTISGINVAVFSNNTCFNNVTLNQHPNGGMASILGATGGYCSGTVRFNTTVNDFNRRCSGFLRAFPSENLIIDGASSYADADLVSQGKSSTQRLNGGNLVALNPRISHDLETQMIKPLATNSHNMGDWGKQWTWNFGWVHASTGTDLYLASYPSSYAPDSEGKSVYITPDAAGLAANANGGDINLTTAAVSGTGVRGKIILDGKEIDASSRQVKNLAAGSASTDAVNKAQLDAVASGAVQFNKERKTVTTAMITAGYVDLAFEAKAKSIVLFVDRLAMHEDYDYSVSVVGGVTRITFLSPMIDPSPEALADGDILSITYGK